MTQLGGSKKDLSMLITYVSADKYLKDSGMLGFVITQSVFRSIPANEFRNFYINPKKRSIKVIKVHDMVDLKPFEDAQNRTAVMIIKEGEKTIYPIPYYEWKKKESISPNLSLDEVKKKVTIAELIAKPLISKKDPWIIGTHKKIEKVTHAVGGSIYNAREGVNTSGANGIYWINIINELPT
ncbi:MAG: hypothetical protein ACE5KT_00805 [Methanosarcinales archaeon]